MAELTYPGVYVQEVPGPRQIVPAASSNAVFIGLAETGPSNTPTLVTSWNQYRALFGGLVWGAHMPLAVWAFFAQGGSVCYVVRLAADPAAPVAAARLTAGSLQVTAASPGAWGDNLAVAITHDGASFGIDVYYRAPAQGAVPTVLDQMAAAYASQNRLIFQTADGRTWYPVEQFTGFTAADLQAAPPALPGIETRINAVSQFIRIAVTGSAPPSGPTGLTPLADGAGDPAPTPDPLTAALGSLDLLTDISLLCVPDTVLIGAPALQKAAIQQALTYAESRPHPDLFCILDPPFGLSPADVLAFKTGVASADGLIPAGQALQSSRGALYYPWITVQNPVSAMIQPMPPSGAMAGRFAATDSDVGPWQAPAGITNGVLTLATGVMQPVTDHDQDSLNPAGVNAIRTIIQYGICAWGARTLSSDPDWIYIPVRRLLTMIEMSLYNSLQWVVFEPSSSQLWGAVTQDVTGFLTTLWQQGALFGATASSAFAVRCDASNNPPDVQAQGQLYIDVMVAPVRPAEFVVIRLQMATLGAG